MSELELEYNPERVNNFSYDGAWLSPDGLFYGCGFAHHEIIAELHLKKESTDLEKLGWARLTEESPFYRCAKPFTQAQINKIFDYYAHIGATYALKFFLEDIKEQEK